MCISVYAIKQSKASGTRNSTMQGDDALYRLVDKDDHGFSRDLLRVSCSLRTLGGQFRRAQSPL